MPLNGRLCGGLTLFVTALVVVGHAWYSHYCVAWTAYDKAVRYRANNCLDPVRMIDQDLVDDCARRDKTITRGVYMAASYDLLYDTLGSLGGAIWVDLLNESIVKLVVALLGAAAAAGLYGFLVAVQRSLDTERKPMLPSHLHTE